MKSLLILEILLIAVFGTVSGYVQDENRDFLDDIDNFIDPSELEDDFTGEEYLDEGYDEHKVAPLKKDPWFFSRRRRRRKRPTNCGRKISLNSSCAVKAYTNGCGPNMFRNAPIPYRSTFTSSCNKHDVCFRCGKTQGWSQRSCDKSFKKDMYKACNCKYYNNAFKRFFCKKAALVLYGLVRAGGRFFYHKKTYSYCRQSCAISYGKP